MERLPWNGQAERTVGTIWKAIRLALNNKGLPLYALRGCFRAEVGNYSLLWGHFVRLAGQLHVHRYYIFGVYVKEILSIRLELSSFFPYISFETAFLLNQKWLLLPSFCGSSYKTFFKVFKMIIDVVYVIRACGHLQQ